MSIVESITESTTTSIVEGIVGGGGIDPLVFHALDDVAGSFSADVIIGTGNLTEARTSTIYLPDDSSPPVWQSYGSGVPGEVYASGQWWLYGAPAATNLQIQSKDLTNAEWTASNMTVAFTATGMTGAANDASDLTATAGNATVIANQIVAASADQTTRWFIKRKTGTGVIEITVDNGTTWQDVTTEVDSAAGFNECIESLAATVNIQIGIRIVTSGDAVYVGNAEAYTAKNESKVRAAGPIFTAAATVSVNKTNLSVDLANHANDQGLYYCEFVPFITKGEPTIGNVGLVSSRSGGTSGQIYIQAENRVVTYDETGGTNDLKDFVAGTAYKGFVGYDAAAAKMWAMLDSGRSSDVAYDGAYSVAAGKLIILGGVSVTYLIRNIRRYDLNLVDGKVEAAELV